MRIKTKISLGLIFLFSVILLVGGLGSYYLRQLANDARAILKDNYESLQYARNMMQALDELSAPDRIANRVPDEAALALFAKNLSDQESNVTEAGEEQVTAAVRAQFNEWRKNPSDRLRIQSLRAKLYPITDLNMQAIVRKSNEAEATADQALLYLAIVVGVCFLITFTFIFNFPGYIANPIQTLTAGIQEIADRNYDQRLSFESNDEFGELAEAFNTMAQKLDEYEHSNLAKILFEKRRIETIINQMQDAVIGLNEKKTLLFANPVATRLLATTEKELVGKYAPDVALTNDLMRNLIQELMPDGRRPDKQEIHPLKIVEEGRESYFSKDIFEVNSKRPNSEAQLLIGYVIILKNITQFKELDVAKTNFIATISHELKTPISSIKMSLQLLEDQRVGELNTEQHRLIENIKDDSRRLLTITGELLDLAQVETGNIQLNFQPTPPGEIMEYAGEAVRFQAEQKRIALQIRLPDDLPRVSADLEKTAWVMVNFLSNAIRYSPEQATIVVEARQTGPFVEFSVRDFGRGIEEKYLGKIFDRYFQVPGNGNGKTGTGLGLAISKEFIAAHSGRIWAESEPGTGSRFCFTLPQISEQAS
ncbi:MAG: HAMP domain-containing protein [Ferruginibacter sp.]|nr:HAMP domain-containing protein [Cytophagales bacterium]